MKPKETKAHTMTLAEKKIALEKYVETTESHDYFELADSTRYEGYILEINEETVLFERAYSPIGDNDNEVPFEIPIQQINIASLR